MKELQNKQKAKKSLYSLISLVALAVVAFFLVRGAVAIMSKSYESSQTLTGLQREAELLKIRSQSLETGIEKLKTEEGVVEEIRSKFNVAREGERVAIVVEERASGTSVEEDSMPWYRRIWNAIIKK